MTELIFTSEYANLLLLMNGIAVILYLVARRKDRERAMRFGNYETLEKVVGRNFLKSSNIALLIRLSALTALVIGISSPVLVEKTVSTDSDYVLAIDSSSSMLAQDVKPSRLEAAKRVSSKFVSKLPESTKVGILSFSGKVERESDLTSEKKNLSRVIESIEIGDSAGTAIGDAISSSTSMLLDSNKSRSVVLITDGRNNVGSSLNESIDFAARENVTIHAIGIGSRRNETQTVQVENGSRADFPNLAGGQLFRISNRTGGSFKQVSNSSQLRAAVLELEEERRRKDISDYFILLAGALLLLEWLVATTRFRTLP